MKRFITIVMVLMVSAVTAQSFVEAYENTRTRPPFDQLNGLYNAQFETLTGNQFEWSKVIGVGYDFNDIRFNDQKLDGSAYLFEDWDNKGVVEVDNKRYLFSNMNYHIYNDQFMSKLDNDSIFVLNSNTVDIIKVNNKVFKGVYDSKKGSTKMYEVIFANPKYTILKGYQIAFVDSSPNPMVNRPKAKIKQNTSYFMYRNKTLVPLKLKKSAVLSLLGENATTASTFAKEKKLSFKKEEHLIQILNHISMK